MLHTGSLTRFCDWNSVTPAPSPTPKQKKKQECFSPPQNFKFPRRYIVGTHRCFFWTHCFCLLPESDNVQEHTGTGNMSSVLLCVSKYDD